MKRGREVGAEQEAVGWGEAREPKMGTTTPRPPELTISAASPGATCLFQV